jgi:TM2 domain-containing membrane protein YozV
MKKALLIFCAFYILHFQFSVFHCNAQIDTTAVKTDSVKVKKHSPKKASWLALIPGAGQIYNKKYWKLPIVYIGLGTTGALIYYYSTETSKYRKEYVARVNGNDEDRNPKLKDETTANVLAYRDYYRRNMEISVAACVIVYALSILDASVDAHFFYYDISDNLSLKVKPKIDYNPFNKSATPSVALVLKF